MVFDSTDTEIKYSGVDMEEAFQMGVEQFMGILNKYKEDINNANYPWNFIDEAHKKMKR